jgi:plasmid maintenance system killer protein
MSFASDHYNNAIKFKESLKDNEENAYSVTINNKYPQSKLCGIFPFLSK